MSDEKSFLGVLLLALLVNVDGGGMSPVVANNDVVSTAAAKATLVATVSSSR